MYASLETFLLLYYEEFLIFSTVNFLFVQAHFPACKDVVLTTKIISYLIVNLEF